LYGNSSYEPEGRRVPWMDLGELRKTILTLLEEVRVDVHWDHMLEQGHDVTDEEIRTALAGGTFELHEDVDGRYVATYLERGAPLAIVVVFEIHETGGGRRIDVVTAYHVPRSRDRAWGR